MLNGRVLNYLQENGLNLRFQQKTPGGTNWGRSKTSVKSQINNFTGFEGEIIIMKRNATAITQNPYIDLVESDDDDEDDNQPDVRIF